MAEDYHKQKWRYRAESQHTLKRTVGTPVAAPHRCLPPANTLPLALSPGTRVSDRSAMSTRSRCWCTLLLWGTNASLSCTFSRVCLQQPTSLRLKKNIKNCCSRIFFHYKTREYVIIYIIIKIIITYHDFLPPSRRDSHVKSDYAYTIIQHTPHSQRTSHLRLIFSNYPSCILQRHRIPSLARW